MKSLFIGNSYSRLSTAGVLDTFSVIDNTITVSRREHFIQSGARS